MIVVDKKIVEIYNKYGIDKDGIAYIRLLTEWKTSCSLKIIPKDIEFSNILEVGCASGVLLKEFSKKIHSNPNIGLEIEKDSIEIARVEFPDGHFLLGDGEQLPFKDKTFDLIIASDILEHFKNPMVGSKEMKRTSKYVIFKIPLEKCLKSINDVYDENHPSGHYHKWNYKEALILLKRMNFQVINYSIEIPPEHIKFYRTRYKKFPFRKGLIFFEKALAKHFKWLYGQIYGFDMFVFCKT